MAEVEADYPEDFLSPGGSSEEQPPLIIMPVEPEVAEETAPAYSTPPTKPKPPKTHQRKSSQTDNSSPLRLPRSTSGSLQEETLEVVPLTNGVSQTPQTTKEEEGNSFMKLFRKSPSKDDLTDDKKPLKSKTASVASQSSILSSSSSVASSTSSVFSSASTVTLTPETDTPMGLKTGESVLSPQRPPSSGEELSGGESAPETAGKSPPPRRPPPFASEKKRKTEEQQQKKEPDAAATTANPLPDDKDAATSPAIPPAATAAASPAGLGNSPSPATSPPEEEEWSSSGGTMKDAAKKNWNKIKGMTLKRSAAKDLIKDDDGNSDKKGTVR